MYKIPVEARKQAKMERTWKYTRKTDGNLKARVKAPSPTPSAVARERKLPLPPSKGESGQQTE